MIDLDDLIAALRERAVSDSPAHTLMNEAADALEAATGELDKVTLDRLQELAEERGYDKGFAAGWKSGGRTADLLAPKLRKAQAERDAAVAALERVRNVLELLRNYAEDSIVTTHGMLSASFVKEHVEIALSELDGAPEPESRWEYRGRLQSCGYVAEGYISAEYAMNGLRVELEDHPYLVMDDTAIVERARVREWLPVEGESKP